MGHKLIHRRQVLAGTAAAVAVAALPVVAAKESAFDWLERVELEHGSLAGIRVWRKPARRRAPISAHDYQNREDQIWKDASAFLEATK